MNSPAFEDHEPIAAGPLRIERLAEVDDALAAQLNAQFDEGMTWDLEQGRLFLRNPDNLLEVAWWEGDLCGFVSAHRLQRFDARRAEVLLYEIGVDERFQRRGVGRALIAEVVRWAEEIGVDEVWVLTNRSNTAAMALYRAAGGEEDEPDVTLFTFRVG